MWCFHHVLVACDNDLLHYKFDVKTNRGELLGTTAMSFEPLDYHVAGEEGPGKKDLPVMRQVRGRASGRIGFLVVHVKVENAPDVPVVPDVPDVPVEGLNFGFQHEPTGPTGAPTGAHLYEMALRDLFGAPELPLNIAFRTYIEEGDPTTELRWLKAGLGCLETPHHACLISVQSAFKTRVSRLAGMGPAGMMWSRLCSRRRLLPRPGGWCQCCRS